MMEGCKPDELRACGSAKFTHNYFPVTRNIVAAALGKLCFRSEI